ncbi:Rad10-domain-containing protein [Ascobolus immersus RN42]|uniref:Rad10-domain-containing protein n=1 Tax=Ascobolus immersus RN42 TaxID=1160509 RepID=A0A3N4IJQ9_ASCIM|nr:Rad10-domain-containing protein [Ascobolus immersus RN42]
MSDDEFGDIDDATLLALVAEAERASKPAPPKPTTQPQPPRPAQPPQPTKPIEQPKPQPLPKQGSGKTILVNPCQKGNPVLTHIRAVPWEWGDIVPDYVVGEKACALYLSLKYHRLHPEYIYRRIKDLGSRYDFRALIIYCDVPDDDKYQLELQTFCIKHSPPLTVLTSGSYQQSAQWLMMLKQEEHCPISKLENPTGKQKSLKEQAIEFVLKAGGGINTTDAINLGKHFGTIEKAVLCEDMDEFLKIPGWGPRKVNAWEQYVTRPLVPLTDRKRVLVKGPQEDGSITQAEYDAAMAKQAKADTFQADSDGEVEEDEVAALDPFGEREWVVGPGKGRIMVRTEEDEKREKEMEERAKEWGEKIKGKDGLLSTEAWEGVEEEFRKRNREKWELIKKIKDQMRREGKEVSPDREFVEFLDDI